MSDDVFDRAIQQLAKALNVGHALAVKLRRDSADSHQHALLLEQSMWTAVSAVKRLQKGVSVGCDAGSVDV